MPIKVNIAERRYTVEIDNKFTPDQIADLEAKELEALLQAELQKQTDSIDTSLVQLLVKELVSRGILEGGLQPAPGFRMALYDMDLGKAGDVAEILEILDGDVHRGGSRE